MGDYTVGARSALEAASVNMVKDAVTARRVEEVKSANMAG